MITTLITVDCHQMPRPIPRPFSVDVDRLTWAPGSLDVVFNDAPAWVRCAVALYRRWLLRRMRTYPRRKLRSDSPI